MVQKRWLMGCPNSDLGFAIILFDEDVARQHRRPAGDVDDWKTVPRPSGTEGMTRRGVEWKCDTRRHSRDTAVGRNAQGAAEGPA